MKRCLAALAAAAALAGCAGRTFAPGVAPAAGALRSAPHAVAPIFDDEFGGSKLNSAWYACYPWAQRGAGCTNGGNLELEWYRRANVSLAGGSLALTARAQRADPSHPYTSGMISTGGTPNSKASFAFVYGYAEARIQFPHGAGMWPAFWLIPADRTWPPEIDIMEWQGVTPRNDIVTIHWGSSKHQQQDGTDVRTGKNLANDFHTYAVDWQPSRVTWYFDGKAVKTFTRRAAIPSKPMYIILNLAIGGWLPGQLRPSPESFPATMRVDYVRVWKNKP